MLLSKHIQHLQEILTQKGDLDILVDCSDENGGSYYAEPELQVNGDTVVIQEHNVPGELNKTSAFHSGIQAGVEISLSRFEAGERLLSMSEEIGNSFNPGQYS